MTEEIVVDWNNVLQCNNFLNNGVENAYFEYVWHKYYDNPELKFEDWPGGNWQFDQHWLIKYYLNFVVARDLYVNSTVLDLGCGISFYAKWVIDCGAKLYHGVEPDNTRYNFNLELSKLRGIANQTRFICDSAETFLQNKNNYDLVLLPESLYYMHNQHEILNSINTKISPRWLIVESVVANESSNHPQGIFTVDYSSDNPKDYDSYYSGEHPRLKIQASRQAYAKLFKSTGWNIHSYYDFKNYQGKDFPTLSIKEGRKMFYVLTKA